MIFYYEREIRCGKRHYPDSKTAVATLCQKFDDLLCVYHESNNNKEPFIMDYEQTC